MHSKVIQGLFSRRAVAKWIGFVLFCSLWMVTRVPWIHADGGNKAMWEYGYFVTDEGYYLGGGKEKFYHGRFVDLDRKESCTWGYAPGMSVLTWGAFNLFGCSLWAARTPFFLINLLAWGMLFWHLARRTLPMISFFLCSIAAFNPYVITYERTACSDVAMASILIISYCVGRKKGIKGTLLSGVIFGCAVWIKLSVYPLLPLALSAVLYAPQVRKKLLHGAYFLIAFFLSVAVSKAVGWMILDPDALAQNTTVSFLNDISNTAGLSYLLGSKNPFLALSAFPRYPTQLLLGVFVPLLIVLVPVMSLKRLADRTFHMDHRLMLYAGVSAYALVIILMRKYYTHYFIPLLMILPVVLLEIRKDLKGFSSSRRSACIALLATGFATGFVCWLASFFKDIPDEQRRLFLHVMSTQLILPKEMPWAYTWKILIAGTLAVSCAGILAQWGRLRTATVAGLVISSLIALSLAFSQLPLTFAPAMAQPIGQIGLLFILLGVPLVVLIWAIPSQLARSRVYFPLLGCILFLGVAFNPQWRAGYRDLLKRTTYHQDAAETLHDLLPSDAVMVGERAPQLLLSLPIKAMSIPDRSPIKELQEFHARFPDQPLYGLVGSDGGCHMADYLKNKDKIGFEPVTKFKLPSFSTGKPVDVWLVKLHMKKE